MSAMVSRFWKAAAVMLLLLLIGTKGGAAAPQNKNEPLLSPPVSKKPTVTSRLGPFQGFPQTPERTSFSWSAAVDRAAGTASSKETSNVLPQTPLGRAITKNKGSDLLGMAAQMFGEYPVWLCRGATSLGLLQAIPVAKGGFEIRTRLFDINLLSFGGIKSRRLSFQTKAATNSPWSSPTKEHDCTVVLPITGGLLALGEKKQDKGAILFTLKTTTRTNDSNGSSRSSLVTAIQGYRPSLCGKAPVHPIRVGLYFGTQSFVHGHVMWRFHRHCRRFGGTAKASENVR